MTSSFFKARRVSDAASARDSQMDVAREIASKSIPNAKVNDEVLATAKRENWAKPNGKTSPRS
jgi:hypothetical protein